VVLAIIILIICSIIIQLILHRFMGGFLEVMDGGGLGTPSALVRPLLH
jgi:hypothetical protein